MFRTSKSNANAEEIEVTSLNFNLGLIDSLFIFSTRIISIKQMSNIFKKRSLQNIADVKFLYVFLYHDFIYTAKWLAYQAARLCIIAAFFIQLTREQKKHSISINFDVTKYELITLFAIQANTIKNDEI